MDNNIVTITFINFLNNNYEEDDKIMIINAYLIYYNIKRGYLDSRILSDEIFDFLRFLPKIGLHYLYENDVILITRRENPINNKIFKNLGEFLGYHEQYQTQDLFNVKNNMSILISNIDYPPNIYTINANLKNDDSSLDYIDGYYEVWNELINSLSHDILKNLIFRLNLCLNPLGYYIYIMIINRRINDAIVITINNIDDKNIISMINKYSYMI